MIWRGTHLRPLSQGPGHAAGAAGGTSNSVAARKVVLRRELRAERAALTTRERIARARQAAAHLLRLPALRRARQVAVYLSAGNELDTGPLIAKLHARHKQVFVPVVDARGERAMHMCLLRADVATRPGRFDIRVPVRRVLPSRRRIDLAVLPLLGYNAQGLRLGSGAGYYDRWLARQRPRPLCVGFAYALQQRATIPAESWDQRLDAICTERGLRYFSRS